MTLDRRTFMAAMGSAVLAMRPPRTASIPRLGVQLYTVRSLLEKDFDGTLTAVAAIGFTEVEFAGYFKQTPQQVPRFVETPPAHGAVRAHLVRESRR